MKMKKIGKKIKKKEKVYFDKTTKMFFVVGGIISFIFFFVIVLSFFIPSLHNFIWLNIKNPISGFMFDLLDFSPSFSSNYFFVIGALFFILAIVEWVLENNTKIDYEKRIKYYNISNRIICIPFFVLFISLVLDLVYFAVPKINYEYFPDNLDKSYTKENLVELTNYFKNEIIEMSDDFDRRDGEIIYNSDLINRAIYDLRNISYKYKFLEGAYPEKVGYFSDFEIALNHGSILGSTNKYGIKVDKSQNNVVLLNTLTHELCHTKGIIRESETEFCAFVAGVESEDKFSNYSAYLNAFYRLTGALYFIDSELNDDIEEEFLNLCLNKEYTEVCNFYSKEINSFMDGTDYFEIDTYRLRNYVHYKNEILLILNTLVNEYDAKLKIGKKNVNIQNIESLIEKDSTDIVRIRFDIDENNFKEIANYLKNNQKYFMLIYQTDEEYDYGDYLEGEEALKYYLEPFNKELLPLLFNFEYSEEYDYERVSRLLLEYYDSLNSKK